jgi:multidrug efflux pump subunit AcrA (membrane-fusion protein)
MIGAFVEARIQAEEIADVVRVDRDHVRKDDTIWLMDDERQLRVRKVEIVFRDAEHAYVASGLEDGDRVVETNLSVVTDGARLRLAGDGPGEGDSTDDDARAEGGA